MSPKYIRQSIISVVLSVVIHAINSSEHIVIEIMLLHMYT
jgi:hypothetical protein